MKTQILTILLLLGSTMISFAQNVGINADGSAPDDKAMLDVKSTTRGMLIPRMTIAQRDAITDPPQGLMVFCTDCGVNGALAIYSGTQWRSYQDCITISPISGTHVTLVSSIQWVWTNTSATTLGYRWNTTKNWATATDVGTSLNYTETGLTCNTPYTRYVWAITGCGVSNPTTLLATTAVNPGTPDTAKGTPAITQIIWKWKAYTGATNYIWNPIYGSVGAINVGNVLSYTQTGLTGATKKNSYIYVVTSCGNSLIPATLTEITQAAPCSPATVDYDGQTYNTLQIGSQCWMKENMNIGTRIAGSTNQTNNSILEKYCFNDADSNCTIYGGLYQWDEAMQYVTTDGAQGICPTGWHVAKKTDWDALVTLAANLKGAGLAGILLKEAGYNHWQSASNSMVGTNEFGFSALGAGYRNSSGAWTSYKQYGLFWHSTSSSTTPTYPYYSNVVNNGPGCTTNYQFFTKLTGSSVRCVKD